MMKHTIDAVVYQVNPIPPYLRPCLILYNKLGDTVASNIEEASKIEADQKIIVEKILKATVMPQPKEQHTFEMFDVANRYTIQVQAETEQFFQSKPGGKQTLSPDGRAPSRITAPTSK